MTGSRQRFTGTMYKVIFIGWLFLGVSSLLGSWWHSNRMYSTLLESGDPWLLTVSDFTWQRTLEILLHKPGALLLAMMLLGAMWGFLVAVVALIGNFVQPSSIIQYGIGSAFIRGSGEWVVERGVGVGLVEYAGWVRGS
jgi:hypothetical protein